MYITILLKKIYIIRGKGLAIEDSNEGLYIELLYSIVVNLKDKITFLDFNSDVLKQFRSVS